MVFKQNCGNFMKTQINKKRPATFALKALTGSIILAIYAGQAQAGTGSCNGSGTITVTGAQVTACQAGSNDIITVNTGASISVGNTTAVDTNSATNSVITNNGSISSTGLYGIGGGLMTNVTITNGGSITTTDPSSSGVNIGNSTGVSLTNFDTISGGSNGVRVTSTSGSGYSTSILNGNGTNAASMIGATGVKITGNNQNTTINLTNESNGVIEGTTYHGTDIDDVVLNNFINNGTIQATGNSGSAAVSIQDSDVTTFTNGSSGQILASSATVQRSAVDINGSTLQTFTNAGLIQNQSNTGPTLRISSPENTLGTVTNQGTIRNLGNGFALQYFLSTATNPGYQGSIVNEGTIETAGTTAVSIGAGSFLLDFTNEGTITGDFIAQSTNALNQLTISGTSARFDGYVNAQGADVFFANGAEYTPLKNQQFYADTYNLSGGKIILDPRQSTTTAGSTMGNTKPLFRGGDFSANGGSFDVVVENNTSYGQLEVTDGNLNLNNSTMNVDIQQNGVLVNGNTLTGVLTTPSGSITYGNFSITDNSALFDFDTVRNSSSLDLTLTANGQGESSGSNNSNSNSGSGNLVNAVNNTGTTSASGIAPVMQGLTNDFINNATTGNAQLDQVVGLAGLGQYATEEQLAQATASLAPASGNAGQQATFGASQVMNIIAERSDYTRALAGTGMNGGDQISDKQFWVQPFGSWTKQDEQDGVEGYKVNSRGLVIGVDGKVTKDLELGLAFSTSSSNVDSDMQIGDYKSDVTSYQLSAYGTKEFSQDLVLNGSVSLGMSDYDTTRTLFNNSQAKSDYDSKHLHVNVDLKRYYKVSDKLSVAGSVGADYHNVNISSYKEKGAGALNLDVDNNSYSSLVANVGGELTYLISNDWIAIGEASIGHDFLTEKNNVTASLTGTGASFTTEGIKPEATVINLGLGAKYNTDNGAEFTLKYNANSRQNYLDQTVSANYRMKF